MKNVGLRLLVNPALDRYFFQKDFDTMLQAALDYGSENNLNLEFDEDKIAAARAAHASDEMKLMFEQYWTLYDELREDEVIPPPSPKAFWEM